MILKPLHSLPISPPEITGTDFEKSPLFTSSIVFSSNSIGRVILLAIVKVEKTMPAVTRPQIPITITSILSIAEKISIHGIICTTIQSLLNFE